MMYRAKRGVYPDYFPYRAAITSQSMSKFVKDGRLPVNVRALPDREGGQDSQVVHPQPLHLNQRRCPENGE
jgi:hypothetical protein